MYLSRAGLRLSDMSDKRERRTPRRRVGRPPAGARSGEKVKDYPQLSMRVPQEMKARLNAVSAVTGLAQWRVIVEAIDCYVHDMPPQDRELPRLHRADVLTGNDHAALGRLVEAPDE